MRFALLIFAGNETGSNVAGTSHCLNDLRQFLTHCPDMTSANIYLPGQAKDKFGRDEHLPMLGIQIYFKELSQLEQATAPGGYLQQLQEIEILSRANEGTWITQQAMYVRHYAVDAPDLKADENGLYCSYVVHYPGPAVDQDQWMHHYIGHHPPIMRTFPGIRSIEILTRVDWISFLPWQRVNYMQRNRVMFDNQQALTEALHSPTRDAMRADFEKFPPFHGGNHHYPMLTTIVGAKS